MNEEGAAADDHALTSDDRKRHEDLLAIMEARRMETDRFAWAVPAIAVASQAFLLTIALGDNASEPRRLIASSAAFVTLLGVCHLFWKHMFGFALYEAVIKRERTLLGLLLVDRNSLLAGADTLEERFQREWMARADGKLVRVDEPDGYFRPRRTIRWRASHVWLLLFGLLLLLDIALAFWALYDWLGWDWFGSDSSDRRDRFHGDD